jgi:hypothetical protein
MCIPCNGVEAVQRRFYVEAWVRQLQSIVDFREVCFLVRAALDGHLEHCSVCPSFTCFSSNSTRTICGTVHVSQTVGTATLSSEGIRSPTNWDVDEIRQHTLSEPRRLYVLRDVKRKVGLPVAALHT